MRSVELNYDRQSHVVVIIVEVAITVIIWINDKLFFGVSVYKFVDFCVVVDLSAAKLTHNLSFLALLQFTDDLNDAFVFFLVLGLDLLSRLYLGSVLYDRLSALAAARCLYDPVLQVDLRGFCNSHCLYLFLFLLAVFTLLVRIFTLFSVLLGVVLVTLLLLLRSLFII